MIRVLKPDRLGNQRCLLDWREGGRKGKRFRQIFFGTRDEARAWLGAHVLAPKRREWGLPAQVAFAAAADEFLAAKDSAERSSSYVDELTRLLTGLKASWKGLELAEISPAHIEQHLATRKLARPAGKKGKARPGAGARTREKEWVELSTFFRWCCRRRYLRDNPVEAVERPKPEASPPRWLRPSEFAALWAKAPDYLRPMLALMVAGGLRSGEVCALRREGVRPGSLTVRAGAVGGKSRKAGDWLVLPLAPAMEQLLLSQPQRIDGLIFSRPRIYHGRRPPNDAWSQDALLRAVKHAAKEAGVTDVDVHTLRHTCASWLVAAGVPIYTVRAMLGHATVTTTERYAHLVLGLDWERERRELPPEVSTFLPLFGPKGSNNSQSLPMPGEPKEAVFQRGNGPQTRK